MFILVTFVMFIQLPVLDKEIVLETNNRFLGDIRPHRSMYAKDDTLLLGAQHQVFHFDLENGKLIRFFGRNGQGPLEFGNIRALNWDGTYYFIVDARALKTSLVDSSGELIWAKSAYFRGLHGTHNFMVGDCKTARPEDYRNSAPTLKTFTFNPKEISYLSEYFHPVSQECLDLGLNYSIHFIDSDENNIFVIDQIRPTVVVYDKNTLAEKKRITLKLPGFSPGPDEFPNFGMPPNMSKYWKWHWSWSRINTLIKNEEKLIIGYDLTCEEINGEVCDNPKSGVYIHDIESGSGKGLKIDNGWILGAQGDNLIVFYDWDDENSEDPHYVIKKYRIHEIYP